MFETLRNFFSRPTIEAATAYPDPPEPKVKPKQQTLPSHLTTAKPSTTSPLPLIDRQLTNTDITTLRQGTSSRQVIRDFTRASPDLSAAVTAYVRVGITSGFTAVAKNLDNTFNPEATDALHQVITRLNVLNDYEIGFDDSPSIRSLSETWARDLMMTGAMSGELVLNKARLPDKIQAISSSQIRFFVSSDGRKLIPKQNLAGTDIDLDIPTFFMVTLDQDTLDVYPVSPLEPAIQAVIFAADFVNDIRRVVKRAIHPRVDVKIDAKKFESQIPLEIRNDGEKLTAYLNATISELEQKVNGLAPEEALVHFDAIEYLVVDHGNTNLSNEYQAVTDVINAKVATGAKVLPTVLGHSNGTANTASAEVLIFMKYVEGAVWSKLNEMFSKMLTLAVRLLGHNVVVEFKYNAIDLRPEKELEAFRAMEQSRILELLSLGLMTDEEASIILTGHLPPKGYTAKTGTGFRPNTAVQPAGDGYNGASNSGSTMNQSLKSDAPTKPKSQKKAETGESVLEA